MAGVTEPPSGFGKALYEGAEPDLDIIAVHGIGAHRDYTWTTGGVNWLQNDTMLPSCFPRARIMAYGYASNWLGQGSIATGLVDVANRLLLLLHDLRKSCAERKLIFIAHCFGGIVVEKILLQALARDAEEDRLLIASIARIALLGTPHQGSSSAGLANIVAAIAAFLQRGQRSPILRTLNADSQLLDDTVRSFATEARRWHLNIHCFYEERETDIAPLARPIVGRFIPDSFRTTLVGRDSACLQGHGGTALTLDHFSLNKFSNSRDANYILIKHVLKGMLSTALGLLDKSLLRCLEELYVVDPEDQLRRIEDNWGNQAHCQTRLDLPRLRFYEWDKDPHLRVLYFTGSTRIGQGLLMSNIARERMGDNACPLAVCVCEIKRDTDVVYVLRTLIWMLVKTHRQLGRHLKDLNSPGKRLSINVLDTHLLLGVFSKVLQDSMISTVYLFIDQEHNCVDQNNLLRDFVYKNASNPASKAKWILAGNDRFQPPWIHSSWATTVNLDSFTQTPEATSFKTSTVEDMDVGRQVWYRVRGLDISYDLDKAKDVITPMLSAQEQPESKLQLSLVPTCDDSNTSQTILMRSDAPLEFLKILEEDFSSFYFVDTTGGKLSFDRHFEGFTQTYANPRGKVIIADILAIPDLSSHAFSSWQPKGNANGIWIQDLFKEDLHQYRTLVYGYNPKFSENGIASAQEFCNELLE